MHNHKPKAIAGIFIENSFYTCAVYAMALDMSVSQSQAGVLSKQLDGLSWFWAQRPLSAYPTPLPHHYNRFTALYSGTTQMSRCQQTTSSGLHGAREDNKRQTHQQSGWASLLPD